MDVSVVIRTLNEARHLEDLLKGIKAQDFSGGSIETIVVDSGSTDGTLEIAKRYGARIVKIKKEDFSFGRSLNVGCAIATGDALVFVSGHCIPTTSRWISELVQPLGQSDIAYSYGKQVGNDESRFSERRIFAKYFPDKSAIPQSGFFVNNANSALLAQVWRNHPFDEDLTGLEDMHLAKRIVEHGYRCAYVAEAAVFHLHDESWSQIRRRFEREALALQHIMPEVQVTLRDTIRYIFSAILFDLFAALRRRRFFKLIGEICMYRAVQFYGTYRGNHLNRHMSRRVKEEYFYPR